MSVSFPSLQFFESLRKSIAENPESTEGVEPSEAYCGFSVGDQLFVLEFDGHECSAAVSGGNPLDLDFVLAGPKESWHQVVAKGDPLAELIGSGALRVESEEDDGEALARAALPMLQAFVDQAKGMELSLD